MKKSILTAVLVVTSLGVSTAEAGLLGDLWELEQRKNAWLLRTFFGTGRSHRSGNCYHCYPQYPHYGAASYGQYQYHVRYEVTPTCAQPVVHDATGAR